MLKPEQIRSHRFISAGRGTYEAGDVDSFLSEVATSYEQVFRENGDLVKKISLLAERVSQYKKDEDNIRRALLTAERMADKIQRESQQSAQEQLDSAEKRAQELIASAQNRADVLETAASVKASQLTEESNRNATERITSAERTASAMISNAEAKANEIIENAKKNAQLELDRINSDIRVNSVTLEKLEGEVSAFRNFILDAYQKHIDLISSLPQKQEMPTVPAINTDEYASGISDPVEDDTDADNDVVIEEPEEPEEAEKDEALAEDAESGAKDSAPDELITAFANESEFSEETAAPDEIVANDILMQSFGVEDTYDPMAATESDSSDSDESDDDASANGFVINVSDIKHHITPDEFEDADTDDDFDTPANVDDFLNDDDDEDDDESDGHSRHSRFRGFFKK
ncbi:MAG: DivIVA domain-containing protein [Acutalibacteraceae bacterium]